jgi:hypothetical protein
MVNTPASYSAQRPGILTEVFRGFPQCCQMDAGTAPSIKPWPLLPNSFQSVIHWSPFHLMLHSLSWWKVSLHYKYYFKYLFACWQWGKPHRNQIRFESKASKTYELLDNWVKLTNQHSNLLCQIGFTYMTHFQRIFNLLHDGHDAIPIPLRITSCLSYYEHQLQQEAMYGKTTG